MEEGKRETKANNVRSETDRCLNFLSMPQHFESCICSIADKTREIIYYCYSIRRELIRILYRECVISIRKKKLTKKMSTHWSHFQRVIWVWLSVRPYERSFVRFSLCFISFLHLFARFYFVLVRGGLFWLCKSFVLYYDCKRTLTLNETNVARGRQRGPETILVCTTTNASQNRIKLDRGDHELDNRLNMFRFFEYVFLLHSKYIYILSPSVPSSHTHTHSLTRHTHQLSKYLLALPHFFRCCFLSLCSSCQFVFIWLWANDKCNHAILKCAHTLKHTHILMDFITVISIWLI